MTSERKPKIVSIIVAVYNEERTVLPLLQMVRSQSLEELNLGKEIIIVESNSSDNSRAICESFAAEKNGLGPYDSVRVIKEDRPEGKGHAVRRGLLEATGDIVIIQDADLEYQTSDYPYLLEPILSGKTEFVLGSRHMAAGHWKIRHFDDSPYRSLWMNFGGVVMHTLFNVVFHQTLTDPTTMYKVFRRDCLDGLNFYANRFDFDFELLAKLVRAGFNPLEVPVSYSSRSFAEGKKIDVWRGPVMWIIAVFRYRFSKLYEGHSPFQMKAVSGSGAKDTKQIQETL